MTDSFTMRQNEQVLFLSKRFTGLRGFKTERHFKKQKTQTLELMY